MEILENLGKKRDALLSRGVALAADTRDRGVAALDVVRSGALDWHATLEARRAELDADTHRPRVLRDSFEGNLWVATRVVPALNSVHVIRSWATLNVAIDGAPILGEAQGLPGFYNAVTVNGVTLGPLIGRLTAEMMRTGRAGPELAPFSLNRFG